MPVAVGEGHETLDCQPTAGSSAPADPPWLISELLETKAVLEAELAAQTASDHELNAESGELERLLGHERGGRATRRLISRRRMLGWTSAGLAGGAGLAIAQKAGAAPLRSMATAPIAPATPIVDASAKSTSPVIYVPPPTGEPATDMVNILQALTDAKAGTAVVFQWSPTTFYAIDQELPIPRGVHITGSGVASELPTSGGAPQMPTLQQAAGTSLYCIAASAAYLAGLYGGTASAGKYPQFNALYNSGKQRGSADSAIEVDHLAFDGQNGGTGSGNTEGHGVVVYSNGSSVHDCYFLNIANAAVMAADLNFAGKPCTVQTFENRIHDNTIVNPGWYGVWVTNTSGSAGCTDGYILNNVVVSPSQQQRSSGPIINPNSISGTNKGSFSEGLHLANAAGWFVVNNELQACPGNGAYFNTTWGLHLVDNVVDGFGCYPQANKTYIGFNVITAGQLKTHPGFVIGNLAAAYEATNPFDPGMPAPSTATFQYFKLSMQTNPGRKPQPTYTAYVVEADNAAHQASQLPPPINGAAIPAGNLNKVTVPQGSSAGVQVGMGITDTMGAIPNTDTVKSVTPGSGSNPDVILLTRGASKAVTGDTVSFVGPTTVAWTYVNDLYDAAMQVYRTNETVTGTILATPAISITSTPPGKGQTKPTITLIDPADYAGGEYVDNEPAQPFGQIIVASGTAGTAAWESSGTEATAQAAGPAGGMLAGEFPNPTFSPDMVATITASGSYPLPAWATLVRVICVGGGGGGGGGASGVGGGGGAAGTAIERIIEVEGTGTMDVSIGRGGGGGSGGASSPGVLGSAGAATRIQLGEVAAAASGGPGGAGGSPGSASVNGGAHGGGQGTTTPVATSSSGGGSARPGGNPFSFSPGGGGGGGAAGNGHGGGGGGAGTAVSGGAGGGSGSSPTRAGGPGQAAGTPSAPGGGGGAGAGRAADGDGGDGGDGAGGFVFVEVIR